MAVKDYKQMTIFIIDSNGVIGISTDVAEGFMSYAKLVASGLSVSLHAVVDLKRRQSIDSFKSQAVKAVVAHRLETNTLISKYNKKLKPDYADIVKMRVVSDNPTPSCIQHHLGMYNYGRDLDILTPSGLESHHASTPHPSSDISAKKSTTCFTIVSDTDELTTQLN